MERILMWACNGESRSVCLGVVASVMEALDSPRYRAALEAADLVTPDGMPLVWMLRRLGVRSASRVYGPDLTVAVLERAQAARIPVGFYGSTRTVLERLERNLRSRFPLLDIAFVESPPFRELTQEEDEATVRMIDVARVRILFVGLGGGKQDLWIAEHRGRVRAVMLGVGAAFDFLAGTKPQAPLWMQRSGLEWLFRLATEPRRLWRRYLHHNPRFVVLALAQILRARYEV
jgi:N-acetylglucosaminyldiphosphoundecaprenol N-acetyl-beta-D-mannosaminyltransferase